MTWNCSTLGDDTSAGMDCSWNKLVAECLRDNTKDFGYGSPVVFAPTALKGIITAPTADQIPDYTEIAYGFKMNRKVGIFPLTDGSVSGSSYSTSSVKALRKGVEGVSTRTVKVQKPAKLVLKANTNALEIEDYNLTITVPDWVFTTPDEGYFDSYDKFSIWITIEGSGVVTLHVSTRVTPGPYSEWSQTDTILGTITNGTLTAAVPYSAESLIVTAFSPSLAEGEVYRIGFTHIGGHLATPSITQEKVKVTTTLHGNITLVPQTLPAEFVRPANLSTYITSVFSTITHEIVVSRTLAENGSILSSSQINLLKNAPGVFSYSAGAHSGILDQKGICIFSTGNAQAIRISDVIDIGMGFTNVITGGVVNGAGQIMAVGSPFSLGTQFGVVLDFPYTTGSGELVANVPAEIVAYMWFDIATEVEDVQSSTVIPGASLVLGKEKATQPVRQQGAYSNAAIAQACVLTASSALVDDTITAKGGGVITSAVYGTLAISSSGYALLPTGENYFSMPLVSHLEGLTDGATAFELEITKAALVDEEVTKNSTGYTLIGTSTNIATQHDTNAVADGSYQFGRMDISFKMLNTNFAGLPIADTATRIRWNEPFAKLITNTAITLKSSGYKYGFISSTTPITVNVYSGAMPVNPNERPSAVILATFTGLTSSAFSEADPSGKFYLMANATTTALASATATYIEVLGCYSSTGILPTVYLPLGSGDEGFATLESNIITTGQPVVLNGLGFKFMVGN